MKLLLKAFLILVTLNASVLSLSSCSEDWEEAYLEIDRSNIEVSNSSTSVEISIETNSNWRVITKDVSWISFDKTSGSGSDKLVVNISQNTSNQRSCTATIVAGTEVAEIHITQSTSTSGTLSVTTGSCTITRVKSGSNYKYTVTATYNVKGGHLASECGIMFGNNKSKTIGTISDGTHTATLIVTTSNPSYTTNYKAYAIKKSNGTYVYGTSKTKKY